MAAALKPTGPYPVLVLSSEQGCGKSTTARVLRALIDPNAAPLRAEPRECRDLMIAANNGCLVGLDNVSGLAPWLSDARCRLSTGGGFSTRELYSDADEIIFNSMRPTLLNGIDALPSRAYLLDRSVSLNLPIISETNRRTESDLWAGFNEAQPRILGALLDAVSAAMRNLPAVKLASLPRMADFGCWGVVAESALRLPAGAFLRAYSGNRAAAHESAIEASAIGGPLLALMADLDAWQGTAAELLAALEVDGESDDRTGRRRDWPKTPRALGSALRRIAPPLRANGIEVSFDRVPGRQRRRLLRLGKLPATPSHPSRRFLLAVRWASNPGTNCLPGWLTPKRRGSGPSYDHGCPDCRPGPLRGGAGPKGRQTGGRCPAGDVDAGTAG